MEAKLCTVFILYDHPLFARGLERLLRRAGEVEVVCVMANGEEALGRIKTLKPDTILVEAEKGESEPGLLLSWLLQDKGEARVVSVSLSRSEAIVYTGRRLAAREAKDLLRAIVDGGEP